MTSETSYKIPLFELNFTAAEAEAAYETIKSGWISTGPKCRELEDKFSSMFGVSHSLTLANCTVALHLALICLGIQPGDEVIVPSLSFVATANAVKYTGAKVVFADIVSKTDLTIDPVDIRQKITSKTKAIIVMHYAGFPCQMDEIMQIAGEYGLKVVEDACHGPLSEYKGKKLGTIGDIGCFSFFSNKNISTGEGGMLVTNNEEYYKRALLLRSHGMTTMSYQRATGHATEYDVIDLGYNYRMDDIRAAIGLVQLDKLAKDIQERAKIRQYYIDNLPDEGMVIPFKNAEEPYSSYIFPIVLENSNAANRDRVRNKLHSSGIQTSVHYPAIHRFSIYRDARAVLPVTEDVSDNCITLPMYSSLSHSQLDYIAQQLKEILT